VPATNIVPQLELIEGLAPTKSGLAGIIDIGSNSIRLVVYQGLSRTPPILFNEKVMAGLGRGVADDGRLNDVSIAVALSTLGRFAMLANDMGLSSLRTVATAAVREAANSTDFIDTVLRETGLSVEIIDGETEARMAALGVIAGIPEADGVVGDLGGGSLELIRVAGGEAHERISMPIGSLRLDVVRKRGPRALAPFIKGALDQVGWAAKGEGKPFYMVGGSWRALAQLHIHLTSYPLPVVHQYAMDAHAPERLVRTLAHIDAKSLRDIPNISTSRAPSLPGAAALLGAVVRRLGSSHIVASAYGLREGLLYAQLSKVQQREDPLIAAARDEGERQGRFPEHGDMLMTWMDGLFGTADGPEPMGHRRLRHAASLLSDIAWRAHPDFRAERGLDLALHGNWVAVTAAERAMLAAALFACFGGTPTAPEVELLTRLAPPAALFRARQWGMALRLGQRLTGGTATALTASRLISTGSALILELAARDAPLYGEAVGRRLKSLAASFGLSPEFRVA
jgi:exopolyphosphatase / guanosine-5'-triphosphate,3'-diphosphate pyrophosphatase